MASSRHEDPTYRARRYHCHYDQHHPKADCEVVLYMGPGPAQPGIYRFPSAFFVGGLKDVLVLVISCGMGVEWGWSEWGKGRCQHRSWV